MPLKDNVGPARCPRGMVVDDIEDDLDPGIVKRATISLNSRKVCLALLGIAGIGCEEPIEL